VGGDTLFIFGGDRRCSTSSLAHCRRWTACPRSA